MAKVATAQKSTSKKSYDPTFFEYLKNIVSEKSQETYQKHILDPEFHSKFQSYMILRYLSMHKSRDIQNFICKYQLQLERMKDQEIIYKFLLNFLPRNSSSFITYIKGGELRPKNSDTENEGEN